MEMLDKVMEMKKFSTLEVKIWRNKVKEIVEKLELQALVHQDLNLEFKLQVRITLAVDNFPWIHQVFKEDMILLNIKDKARLINSYWVLRNK
jgi:hypothetical protein